MIVAALAAIGFAWLLGALVVSVLWPRSRPWRADLGLILPLGLGMGMGITSVLFFFASFLSPAPLRLSMAWELLIDAGLAWRLGRRPRRSTREENVPPAKNPWLFLLVASAFVQAGLVAAVTSWRAYAAEPHGGWDGWAIWNLHARFIFFGGKNWAQLLQSPPLAWTHSDYPLLVSASVARGWAFVGADAPFVSGLISALFGIATIALLVAAVARLRQRMVAGVGGLILLGTPFFVTFASNEHADIPLGFFILATLVLAALCQRTPESWCVPALAGLCAGLAAWTKNEGLLFAVVAAVGWIGLKSGHGSRHALGAFLIGLFVALLPVICFKAFVAPPNDIVSAGIGGRLAQLLDGSRHRLILSSFWHDATRFGEWSVVPFLAMALPLLVPGTRRLSRDEGWIAVILTLMGAGYYAVYLVTPWDLAWHLDSSLVRLLLQLWPAAVFFWCLAIPGNEVTAESAPFVSVLRRRFVLPLVMAANVGMAAWVGTTFAGQLAPNQLAVAQVVGGEASLTVGEGWFARERDKRHQWMWSKGESTLFLHNNATQPVTVTLRLGVRGLGTRTMQVMIGTRVAWHGTVAEALASVEMAGLVLPPGITMLTFKTDAPGVLESTTPGARALTFALYDPRLN